MATRLVFAATALLALPWLGACQSDQQATAAAAPSPPDAKAMILHSKAMLWKDPDSIKSASITAPRRHLNFMWHVCVKANARNGFGAYAGEKDMLIGLYDDGKLPAVLMSDGTGYCDYPHEPFPELEGGYKPPVARRT